MPKPPPTSGACSRMRSSGILNTNSASWRRMPCTPCPVSSRSNVSVGRIVARDARRACSIGTITTRLFITSISTMCAASFIACATAAASPFWIWNAVLRGAWSQSERRAVGERRAAVDDRRQRLVVDLDQLGGLAGDRRAVGDDERHRVADMAHAIDGERVARRHDQRRHRAPGRASGRGRPDRRRCRRRARRRIACAAAASIRLMSAWACGERRTWPHSAPGQSMSAR